MYPTYETSIAVENTEIALVVKKLKKMPAKKLKKLILKLASKSSSIHLSDALGVQEQVHAELQQIALRLLER